MAPEPSRRAACSPRSESMSLTTTFAPSAEKRFAMPSPNPEAAPVTIATLPSRRMASPLCVLERAMLAQLVDVPGDPLTFRVEKFLHRPGKLRVREPVRGEALDRKQP